MLSLTALQYVSLVGLLSGIRVKRVSVLWSDACSSMSMYYGVSIYWGLNSYIWPDIHLRCTIVHRHVAHMLLGSVFKYPFTLQSIRALTRMTWHMSKVVSGGLVYHNGLAVSSFSLVIHMLSVQVGYHLSWYSQLELNVTSILTG